MIPNAFYENDGSPEFYKRYPRLFYRYFEGVDAAKVVQLSKAGYLYYHATLLTDALIDDRKFSNFPIITMLQEETIKMLTDIYGIKSEFWTYWNARREDYFEAVKIEKKLNYDAEVTLATYKDLADKKAAFGKVAIDCLYLLSNKKDEKLYQVLLRSHHYFSIGFQLYDDVKDFREDFEKGQFNWAIYEQRRAGYYEDFKADIDSLHKLLFIHGTAQKVMSTAISFFQIAVDILGSLKVESEWKGVIEEMKGTLANYLDITVGYVKTIEQRLKIKENTAGFYIFIDYAKLQRKEVKLGLHYLKGCYLNNYSDLKHIMYLSDREGFENREDIHVTDVFQRAMLNDCLIAICEKYKLDFSDFFNKECQYLIPQRNTDAIGGWSYFPSVKEIAADIDDLGQIMQLFIKSGNSRFVKDYCQAAIDLALADRVCSSGGIETWIIPKENRTSLQEKQELFNTTKWGKGPDVEVVANFIYALSLYDATRYAATIANAIAYILDHQNAHGFWQSRWYYGNYYGTYVCLRVLRSSAAECALAIQKALEYLLDQQLTDGGFSMTNDRVSDALSTALAVLSLSLFLNTSHRSIKNAVAFLKANQRTEGYWEATDFIKPKAQEPYKSKTLTTAYCLKALSIAE